jgi:hypothetical protein
MAALLIGDAPWLAVVSLALEGKNTPSLAYLVNTDASTYTVASGSTAWRLVVEAIHDGPHVPWTVEVSTVGAVAPFVVRVALNPETCSPDTSAWAAADEDLLIKLRDPAADLVKVPMPPHTAINCLLKLRLLLDEPAAATAC